MAAQIGKPFPAFNLKAVLADGTVGDVSNATAGGKWLLVVYYPFAFTGVCQSEIGALKARFAEFAERGVAVMGASCDSQFTQKEWIVKEFGGSLPYPLAADFKKELAAELGILHEGLGCAYRGTFLVDDKGALRAYGVNDLAIGRSTEEMLRLIDAFQSGGACMVDWKKKG